MASTRVGVIGVGHLGYHHARNFAGLEGAELLGVVDPDEKNGGKAAHDFGVPHFRELDRLLEQGIDAASVVVPTSLHYDTALRLLDAGWDILYFPQARMLHNEPRGILNVQANPRHALITRNRFWIVLKRYPLPMALRYIAPRAVLWGCRSIRYGYTGSYLKGLLQFVRMVPRILRGREVITPATVRRLREIETSARGE